MGHPLHRPLPLRNAHLGRRPRRRHLRLRGDPCQPGFHPACLLEPQLLYICVFGESLLNDAVTIVLYQSLEHVARNPPENVVKALAVEALVSFPMVTTGGILMGLVWVCITALATK